MSFRVDLCFPFGWQRIWDLFGRMGGPVKPSGEEEDGPSSSLGRGKWERRSCHPKFFIFSPAPAGAGEAAGEIKAGPNGRRRENPNPGWAGTGSTRARLGAVGMGKEGVPVPERTHRSVGTSLGGCRVGSQGCVSKEDSGDAQVPESSVAQSPGLAGGGERTGQGFVSPFTFPQNSSQNQPRRQAPGSAPPWRNPEPGTGGLYGKKDLSSILGFTTGLSRHRCVLP